MNTKTEELKLKRDSLFKHCEKNAEKQHSKGKLTARERLDLLFDKQTFMENFLFARHRCTQFDMTSKEIAADGVITGSGYIDDRLAFAFSQDFTSSGGSVGEIHADKICKAMQSALKYGAPLIGINDSGGARIQEGVQSLSGYGRIFFLNTQLSGVVPQISIISGPCAGGAAYSPALSDFVIMVRGVSQMFITGPHVVKAATGEDITAEELGGVNTHMCHSGVAHFIAEDDDHALRLAKRLLSYLPSNNIGEPPLKKEDFVLDELPALDRIVPENPKESYDMKDIISRLTDTDSFMEVQSGYAKNIIVGFARIAGRPIGIVANQPMFMAGVIDIDASDKAARFINFCNAFNLPLINLVDVPGFLPGIEQEYGGIIRHGAKLLYAYSHATVPKITVIIRKAYGGAYLAMCSRDLGADAVFAWPTAEIAVMGAEGAANIVFAREIKDAKEPEQLRSQKIEEYRQAFANPYIAAGYNFIDDVIFPRDTRRLVGLTLENCSTKKESHPYKKNGVMPV
ncbi:MAG: acyl-CoA carboxylase subunit beta [Candidatus Wallbacteria bacterium]|nr:acyl-CoA carboxylase subunit beta [Candidatus Wallbacteria bacterium]